MRLRRRLQRALLRLLATRLRDKHALRLLRLLGARFGVEELAARSALGVVQGRLDDEIVFGRYLRTGEWAPQLSDFLVRCFAGGTGGSFVDVGANIGLVTLAVARLDQVDCACFEPEPRNLALLRANLARAGLAERVEVFPFALFERSEALDLELAAANRGDHRVRAAGAGDGQFGEAGREVIEVTGRALDDVLDPTRLRAPLVIKCDTQGCDLHVWSGGEKVFGRADALVIEFWPYGLERLGADPELLVQRLEATFDLGQVARRDHAVRPEALRPMREVAAELRRFRASGRVGAHLDVVAVKRGFAERLAAAERREPKW